MRASFREWRKKRFSYTPLVEVHISESSLLHNLNIFEKLHDGVSVAPVVKSNAYGHGLVEVARVYDNLKSIPFLVIDTYAEALMLRNEKIRKPLLVIGNTLAENIARKIFTDVSFTVTSLEQLKEFAQIVRHQMSVHIKVDTGMHRQGVMPDELDEVIHVLKNNNQFVVEGFCSHLPDADGESETFTKQQIEAWNELAKNWREHFPETKYFHLSNTAGRYFNGLVDANVSRVGIGLYGFEVQPRTTLGLKPALEMRTVVSQVKKLKKGDKVGYNITFEAPREMAIAVVPVGYNEGVPRRLSNKGFIQVRGVECPIVGRVSMNITTVDVSRVPNVKRGDEVTVISADPKAQNSVAYMVKLAETIPYVILVHIPESLRRVVV